MGALRRSPTRKTGVLFDPAHHSISFRTTGAVSLQCVDISKVPDGIRSPIGCRNGRFPKTGCCFLKRCCQSDPKLGQSEAETGSVGRYSVKGRFPDKESRFGRKPPPKKISGGSLPPGSREPGTPLPFKEYPLRRSLEGGVPFTPDPANGKYQRAAVSPGREMALSVSLQARELRPFPP